MTKLSKLTEAAVKAGIGLVAAGGGGAVLAVAPQVAAAFVEWLFTSPILEGTDEVVRDQLRADFQTFITEREALFREELRENARLVSTRVEELEARMTAADRASMAYVTVPEAAIIVQQFIVEARRSIQEERVRLMAAALAGSFRPDISSEMRSRVARVLSQLEPGDILALRTVAQTVREHANDDRDESYSFAIDATACNVLLQTGCMMAPSARPSWPPDHPGGPLFVGRAQASDGGADVEGSEAVALRRSPAPSTSAAFSMTAVGQAVLTTIETWQAA